MAEGIFKQLVEKEGLLNKITIDSAGTSRYHSGSLPDERMRAVAKKHGIELTHKARQLTFGDFYDFHYIVAMDRANLEDIISEKPVNDDHRAKIVMMRQYDPQAEELDVPDPYYGGHEGFENVYQMLQRSCQNLLHEVKEELAIRLA